MSKFNLLHIYKDGEKIKTEVIMSENDIKSCQALKQELVRMLRKMEVIDSTHKLEYVKDGGVAITNKDKSYIDALIICEKCEIPLKEDEAYKLLAKTFDIFREPINVYVHVDDDVSIVDEDDDLDNEENACGISNLDHLTLLTTIDREVVKDSNKINDKENK